MGGRVWGEIRREESVFGMGDVDGEREGVDVNGRWVDMEIRFGFDVFRDEKERGMVMKFKEEEGFFCGGGYEGSKSMVERIVRGIEKGE